MRTPTPLFWVAGFAAFVIACGSSGPALDPNATPSADLHLVARDLHFDRRGLAVPAGEPITIGLDNQDQSVRHNFAFYADKRASEIVFVGELFEGKSEWD